MFALCCYRRRINKPLKNGDVLELVMVNAPFDLTSVVFICEVGGVPREELKVDSPKVILIFLLVQKCLLSQLLLFEVQ